MKQSTFIKNIASLSDVTALHFNNQKFVLISGDHHEILAHLIDNLRIGLCSRTNPATRRNTRLVSDL